MYPKICRPSAGIGKPVVPGGAGGATMAPPDFVRSVNPISTKKGRLCPPNNTGTPGFSDLPTALIVIMDSTATTKVIYDVNLTTTQNWFVHSAKFRTKPDWREKAVLLFCQMPKLIYVENVEPEMTRKVQLGRFLL